MLKPPYQDHSTLHIALTSTVKRSIPARLLFVWLGACAPMPSRPSPRAENDGRVVAVLQPAPNPPHSGLDGNCPAHWRAPSPVARATAVKNRRDRRKQMSMSVSQAASWPSLAGCAGRGCSHGMRTMRQDGSRGHCGPTGSPINASTTPSGFTCNSTPVMVDI